MHFRCHERQRTIYIKEIIKGESYIPLGEEEKKALAKALGNDLEQ